MERLLSDVEALNKLTVPLAPPRVGLQAQDVGDASGAGFVSALIKEVGILYESITWTQNWKEESLNFREADNLMTKIKSLVAAGKIRGQEVFLFIDNSAFELTYYQAYSTSWKLLDIILQLYQAI